MNDEAGASMTAYVRDALQKIYKASSRRHKLLRRACTQVLEYTAKLSPQQQAKDNDADKYFLPFKLACETESSKMMEIALDCIQKLIAYGYLRGSGLADPSIYPPNPQHKDAGAAAANKQRPPNGVDKARMRERRRLIDVLIETVYECSMYENDKVQLQVIKALLTAVTSVTCKVHAHSLLLAVRACYHIFLTSRNMVNQTTAKATLTQMLNIVFQRMEHFANQLKEADAEDERERKQKAAGPGSSSGATPLPGAADGAENKNGVADPSETKLPETSIAVSSENRRRHSHSLTPRDSDHEPEPAPRAQSSEAEVEAEFFKVEEQVLREAQRAVDYAATHDAGPAPPSALKSEGAAPGELAPASSESSGTTPRDSSDGGDHATTTTARSAVSTAPGSPAFSVASSHHSPGLSAANGPNVPLPPLPPPASLGPAAPSAPGAPAQGPVPPNMTGLPPMPPPNGPRGKYGYCVVCGSPANTFCAHTNDPVCSMECKVAHFDDIINAADPYASRFSVRTKVAAKFALLQNDAYLLFRALCKLSMKVLPQPPEQIALQSKVLSLELLLSILDNPGPTFRNSEVFVELVRENLVMSLLQNSVTTIEPVFKISSSLFVTLIAHFKPHLKTEIGVFLDNIFLKMLATPNSTYAHKKTALKVIHTLCSDPQTLVELFLNYDCEFGSFNIFQSIINQLEKVAQGRFMAKNWMSEEQENALRRVALDTFGAIMKSLMTWTRNARPPGDKDGGHAQAILRDRPREGKEKDSMEDEDDKDALPLPLQTPTPGLLTNSGSLVLDADTDGQSDQPRPAFSQQFTKQQELRRKKETAIVRFNLKPKKGYAYMLEHGLIDNSPEALADLIWEHRKLMDKDVLGEYLGEHHDFQKKVLYAFVDKMDFTGLSFDDGIRMFISFFRLPGEAQKIDRMMEKFADSYCRQNPGKFSSADTAYVLAYAVIMLNTDAHNPGIKGKDKMTKEDFLRNNRGIDNDRDLDPQFLGDLYDRIVNNEIKMRDPVAFEASTAKPAQTRLSSFLAESQKMVQQTQELIRRQSTRPSVSASPSGPLHSRQNSASPMSPPDAPTLSSAPPTVDESVPARPASTDVPASAEPVEGAPVPASAPAPAEPAGDDQANGGLPIANPLEAVRSRRMAASVPFYQATPSDFEAVRPMFDIVWYPALATFSQLFEEAQDPRLITLCLDCYRYAIPISSVFNMDTPRVAFIKSLKQCTLLGSQREIQQKNIDAIKILLEIAHTHGDHLKDSWGEVLICISEFERLHLIASGARPKMDIFMANRKARSASDAQNEQAREALDTANSQSIVHQVEASLIDRIFTNSANLSSEAIVDFVNHLRMVSEAELGIDANRASKRSDFVARVFSLQKIVEITYYNMGRIRLVWSRVWHILSDYFAKAGKHENHHVSMFVIDSLRQLAMKFLEKDELSSYQFQKQFLKPFEGIMSDRSQPVKTRDLVVQCLSRMILARVHNVKSGWKSVFVVFTYGAQDQSEGLVASTFDIVNQIMRDFFPLITDTIDEVVNCLVAFGENEFTDISLQAIEHIGRCAQWLGEHHDESASSHVLPMALQSVPRVRANSLVASQPAPAPPGSVQAQAAEAMRLTKEKEREQKDGAAAGAEEAKGPADNIGAWFLVLTGLSRLISDRRLEVRARALQVMFKILHTHGGKFSQSTWQMIFRGVLFPIFDDVVHSQNPRKQDEEPRVTPTAASRLPNGPVDPADPNSLSNESWLKTTCLAALSTLIELFAHFQSSIAFLLPEMLELINNVIDQEQEELSRIGIKCWVRLMGISGPKFCADEWSLVLTSLRGVFVHMLPTELVSEQVRAAVGLGRASEASAQPQPVQSAPYQPAAEEGQHESGSAAEESAPSDLPPPTLEPVPSDTQPTDSAPTEPADASAVQPSIPPTTLRNVNIISDLTQSAGVSPSPRSVSLGSTTATPTASASPSASLTAPSTRPASASVPRGPSAAPAGRRGPHPPPGPPPAFAARPSGPIALPFNTQQVITKCKGQLILMDALFEVFQRFMQVWLEEHFLTVLDIIMESVRFARAFNSDKEFRQRLWQAGFMRDRQPSPPELFYQEAHGLQLHVQILSRLYTHEHLNGKPSRPTHHHTLSAFRRDSVLNEWSAPTLSSANGQNPVSSPHPELQQSSSEDDLSSDSKEPAKPSASRTFTPQFLAECESRLIGLSTQVLQEYLKKVKKADADEQNALRCLSSVICAILDGFTEFSDEQFRRQIPPLYHSILELVRTGSANIRECLYRLLFERITPLLPLQIPEHSAALPLSASTSQSFPFNNSGTSGR